MPHNLLAKLNSFASERAIVLSDSASHGCPIREEYIIFQRDAIIHAIDEVRQSLSRLRRTDVSQDEAYQVLCLGAESELDCFMNLNGKIDSGRNFNSFAIGYYAGHCGYTCPRNKGCNLAKLFTSPPNYDREDPGEFETVVGDFCQEIGVDLMDLAERDAIARFLAEHKWFVSGNGNVGLRKAEEDFERKYNKFFINLGFKLGRSQEYAAYYVWDRLRTDEWMSEVHGIDANANDYH